MHGPVRGQLQRLGRLRGGCVDRRRSLELARRARQAVRGPGRALDAVRDSDGGVLHADSGKDHQGPPRPGGLLMANTTRVVMPQLGESVHEGTISKWLVKTGDKVVEFEPMLEVDTDKVNAEVPAPVTGILREILAKEGETVQAGAEIAVVEVGPEGAGGADGKASATPEAPATAAAATPPKAVPSKLPVEKASPEPVAEEKPAPAVTTPPQAEPAPPLPSLREDLPAGRGGQGER